MQELTNKIDNRTGHDESERPDPSKKGTARVALSLSDSSQRSEGESRDDRVRSLFYSLEVEEREYERQDSRE